MPVRSASARAPPSDASLGSARAPSVRPSVRPSILAGRTGCNDTLRSGGGAPPPPHAAAGQRRARRPPVEGGCAPTDGLQRWFGGRCDGRRYASSLADAATHSRSAGHDGAEHRAGRMAACGGGHGVTGERGCVARTRARSVNNNRNGKWNVLENHNTGRIRRRMTSLSSSASASAAAAATARTSSSGSLPASRSSAAWIVPSMEGESPPPL